MLHFMLRSIFVTKTNSIPIISSNPSKKSTEEELELSTLLQLSGKSGSKETLLPNQGRPSTISRRDLKICVEDS
jgi:hypothetical protein